MHFNPLRVDFLLRRFGPLLVKTKMNFRGVQACVSRQRPLWGNRAKAVAHPRAQQQRTVLRKLFLGPQEVVQRCDMQRLPPTRMIVTWYPARATGFSTSKPRQDDASSNHLQECLSMQQLNLKNTRLANNVHSRRPQPTVDRGLSRGVFEEPVRDSRIST